jgi:hypothetical protein
MILVLSAIGCIGSASAAPSRSTPVQVSSVRGLRKALNRVGLKCRRFTDASVPGDSVESALCLLHGEPTTLSWYSDSSRMEAILADTTRSDPTCPKGTSFPAAVGSNWIVAPSTRTLAKLIAERLGGTVRNVAC